MITKNDIQQFVVKLSMEFSHYTSFCTQIWGGHGEIQRMQSYSRCKERTHLQLSRAKDPNSAQGMEQVLSE